MLRKMMNVSVVASLLVAGCAEGDGFGDGMSELPEAETSGDGGAIEDGEVTPEEDDDDADDADLDPQGRITWIGEEDGDLLVHATVEGAALGQFPGADHYEIRIDEDGAAMYAQVVDGQGDVLELVRLADGAPILYPALDEAVSMCFPFPFLPPIVSNCFVQPCPWEEDWPGQGGGWPDCMEVSQSGEMLRMVGSVGGTPFGQEVTLGEAPVPIFDVPLTPAQEQRLARAEAVAFDLNTLGPELEELDLDCLDCMLFGAWIAGKAIECTQADFQSCVDAYWGYHLYDGTCGQACGG